MTSCCFIRAEYCDADLYTGWHLYARDRNDSSPNDDGDWGWLRRGDMSTRSLAKLLPSLPQLTVFGDTFAEIEWHNRFVAAFVERFPDGIRVERDGYQLIRLATEVSS